MKKKIAKFLAVLMCFMTAVAYMPTFAFAADGNDSAGIIIYLTVNNQGNIAKAKDGSAMAWKEVKVTDIDGDTHFTVDEALVAAHKTYLDGDTSSLYECKGYVQKLWGVKTSNTLFLINGQGISTGVKDDNISDGDYLTASINADSTTYGDWYVEFSKDDKAAYMLEAKAGEEISLTAVGHLGMAYLEADKAFKSMSNITVGLWNNGQFESLEKTTGSDGKAKVSFDKPGTYIVTGQGKTEGTVTDYGLMELGNKKPPYGTMDFQTYESKVAYTDADYGEGPYPADEIKYIDFFEEASEESENDYAWEDLHYLKSNKIIKKDLPIMAPVCVVTVTCDHKYEPFKNAAGQLRNGSQGEKCEKCGDIQNYKVLPGWSKNYVKKFRVSKSKRAFTAKWRKQSSKNRKQFSGYQIRYSTKRSMVGAVYKTASKNARSKKIKKLAKNKRYYVQVRSYKTYGGKRYYAGWSAIKSVKTR